MDNLILIINAMIWISVFINCKKRYGLKNTGVIYVAFYALLNIVAIHYYNNNYEGNRYVGQNLLFLLYDLLFIFLFCRPLIKVEHSEREFVITKEKQFTLIAWCIAIISLFGIYDIVTNFYQGLIMLSQDEDYGASLYHELRMSMDESKSGITNHIAVLTNLTRSISPFLFFVYLSFPRKNFLLVAALFLASFSTILNAVSIGSRSAIVDGFMIFGSMIFYMWKYYSSQVKKLVSPIIVSLFAVITVGFVSITVSRSLRYNVNSFEFVEKYLAVGPLNFGKYGLDNGEIRYGDRTVPLIKSAFSSDVARTYSMRIDKYKNMKINESTFATFIADFVFDYGVVAGSFIMLLLISFFNKGINSPPYDKLYIHHIALIYLLISILNGFYLYPLSDYLGNMKFLAMIGIYLYFKHGTKLQIQRKKNRGTFVNI